MPRIYIKFGSGGRIRTDDLWVMSPTSYLTAPPRVMCVSTKAETSAIAFNCQVIYTVFRYFSVQTVR